MVLQIPIAQHRLTIAVLTSVLAFATAGTATGQSHPGLSNRPRLAPPPVDDESAMPPGAGQASETPAPTRSKVERRKASDLISVQQAPKISSQLLEKMTPDKARIVVSLSKQRAFLISGDQIVIDTPVSTGKRSGWTPTGDFTILQKSKDHRSNIYGSYVDAKGRTVRSGVSTKIDSAPSGTRFLGSPMRHFMRITWTGVGLHEGELPGYPASHGCIRLPGPIAEMIYGKVMVGTPVSVIP